jgi:hypothetical protein
MFRVQGLYQECLCGTFDTEVEQQHFTKLQGCVSSTLVPVLKVGGGGKESQVHAPDVVFAEVLHPTSQERHHAMTTIQYTLYSFMHAHTHLWWSGLSFVF